MSNKLVTFSNKNLNLLNRSVVTKKNKTSFFESHTFYMSDINIFLQLKKKYIETRYVLMTIAQTMTLKNLIEF